MEIVNREGRPYFAPAAEREQPTINSFRKWEQAFRIYAGVFCEANPQRSHELFQHINNIHEASLSFAWDNVYEYEMEFRQLMARNPTRNWGVIYHQGWIIKLRDHHPKKEVTFHGLSEKKPGKQKKDISWKFNKGRCNFGSGCRFEHQCALCERTGHSKVTCFKREQCDKEKDKEKKEKH